MIRQKPSPAKQNVLKLKMEIWLFADCPFGKGDDFFKRLHVRKVKVQYMYEVYLDENLT